MKAQGALSKGVLEARVGEWARWVSMLQRISRQGTERERERERGRRGLKPLVEEGCFNDLSVNIYKLLYKKFLSTLIKIRKPNVQQPLPKEQGINNGHKVRRQSISQERGSRLSNFVIRMVSSSYLRLLIFLSAILIPACASSNPACTLHIS